MEDRNDNATTPPLCDCGYSCTGETVEDRVRDALSHAREAHGIDVSRDQVLASGQAPSTPGLRTRERQDKP